jgi:uncharacterized protein (TIGR03083 family)
VTTIDRDRIVAVLDEQFDAILALTGDLDDGDWDRPTACPGWSVKDNVSHVVGTESMLLGRDNPEVDLPDDLAHVRNDIGRFNEAWVQWYRPRPPADVVADLRQVIDERRRALAGMDQAAFDQESFTPAGPDTYGRFMRIRVMDMWTHEQDIREAVGRPGHLDGRAPATALDEVSAALGYVVGKKAAAPAGSTVRIELTGPIARRIDIEVSDRARVVDALVGEPTTTLRVPGDHFMRLVAGRGADPGKVAVEGDAALGASVVDNLAYMI